MRIIFWGTPEYSVKSLEVLKNSEHDIVAVVTQPDKKRSRGNKLIASPVKEFAIHEKIPVFTPNSIKGNNEFKSQLEQLSCDLFIVIAYGKIRVIENMDEKRDVLYGLLQKYFGVMKSGKDYRPITDNELKTDIRLWNPDKCLEWKTKLDR